MKDYEDLILAYQDWESDYDECSECEYASVEKCRNQCMEIHTPNLKLEMATLYGKSYR